MWLEKVPVAWHNNEKLGLHVFDPRKVVTAICTPIKVTSSPRKALHLPENIKLEYPQRSKCENPVKIADLIKAWFTYDISTQLHWRKDRKKRSCFRVIQFSHAMLCYIAITWRFLFSLIKSAVILLVRGRPKELRFRPFCLVFSTMFDRYTSLTHWHSAQSWTSVDRGPRFMKSILIDWHSKLLNGLSPGVADHTIYIYTHQWQQAN